MKVLVTGGSGMICYGIQQIQDTYSHEFKRNQKKSNFL